MDFKQNHTNRLTSALRSGNLSKFLETNQKHHQDVVNALKLKVKQCEEDIVQKRLLLQQNSISIDEFQNQIRELSEQNCKYADEQQKLLDENLYLKNKLMSAEERFAELDIAYDEQVFSLTNRINELETRNVELNNAHNKAIDEVIQAEKMLNEELKDQQTKEKLEFQAKINEANENMEALKKELFEANAEINKLQNNLAHDSRDEEIQHLTATIEKLNKEKVCDQNKFRQERSQLINTAENLRAVELEICKEKLTTQDNKMTQAYTKYKQLSRITAAISDPHTLAPSPPDRIAKRKQSSSDDSSDSDSLISFYDFRKRRKPEITGLSNHDGSVKNKQSANVAPLVFTKAPPISRQQSQTEENIPETSSSSPSI